jgi:predicted ATP-dependent endonuclease of OLD family
MHIYSIHLENIKAFELDFERPGQVGERAYAGLNFFVGGNSSGKSSLLKSLAIGIAGPTVANQLLVSPGLRRTRLAWVNVTFDNEVGLSRQSAAQADAGQRWFQFG